MQVEAKREAPLNRAAALCREEGAAADLLGSFNVATFNTAEDDATFWERLIPPEERCASAAAAGPPRRDRPPWAGSCAVSFGPRPTFRAAQEAPISPSLPLA
jgi:hypothetical protein